MDPFAALSVACNIMQVIQFSSETIAVFKRLRGGASPDESARKNSESLMRITDRLRKALSTPATKNGISPNLALVEVCEEVIQMADTLRKQSRKCLTEPGASTWIVFWKSIAYQLKHKSAIEKLSQQLDRAQSRMELEILLDLQGTLRESKDETADRLGQMDDELQRFYKLLLDGQTRLHDLVEQRSGEIKRTVKDEGEKIRQFTDQRVRVVEDVIEANQSKGINSATYKQFLNGFRFPQFNARRNMIESPYEDTFKWIFQEPDAPDCARFSGREWDSFPNWLRHGKGLYWISGKPGAGKSTLMQFILKHRTTHELLLDNNPDFIVISAFVWSAGTLMQRSLAGILCTLLQQLFSQCIEIYEDLIKVSDLAFADSKEPSDWSLETLKGLFSDVIRKLPRPVCMFIDGLDEIDRSNPMELTALMEWLDDASSQTKLCVSSRLEDPFERRFSKCNHLRVQDLTANDIGKYVSSSLQGLEISVGVSQDALIALVRSIVTKAEGVFLWVHLVVEHIRTDAELLPSWTDLERRVIELPQGIYPMYEMMWNRQHGHTGFHRAETAYYLNAVLSWVDRHTVDLLLLFTLERDVDLQKHILEGSSPISLHLLLHKYSDCAARVRVRCGGLLSCRDISPLISGTKTDEHVFDAFFNHNGPAITFIHRTAHDFLGNTEAGQKILKYDSKSALEHTFIRAISGLYLALISGASHELSMITEFVMPLVRDFQDPIMSAATFGLIVQGCRRKPSWRFCSIASPNSVTMVSPSIAQGFYFKGFDEHFERYFETFSPDIRLSAKVQLLEAFARYGAAFELNSIIQQLGSMSLEDLSHNVSILPYAQLAAALFNVRHAEWLEGLHGSFIQHLLKKCGSIYSLSKWRVVVARTSSKFRFRSGFREHDSPDENQIEDFGINQRIGEKEVVTLTETSMLHAYTADRSRNPRPFQRLLNEVQSHDFTRFTSPPKVIMILELDFDQDGLIADIASKPIRDSDTSELLVSQIEKHRSRCLAMPWHNLDQENLDGADLKPDTCSEFPLFEFYNRYHEAKLNSRGTLEYLVKEGFLSTQSLEFDDPLNALVQEAYVSRKTPSLADFDWSVQVDVGPYNEACKHILQQLRDVNDPRAIAPDKGGMLFYDAYLGWFREESLCCRKRSELAKDRLEQ